MEMHVREIPALEYNEHETEEHEDTQDDGQVQPE